jgi:hypothetical protein
VQPPPRSGCGRHRSESVAPVVPAPRGHLVDDGDLARRGRLNLRHALVRAHEATDAEHVPSVAHLWPAETSPIFPPDHDREPTGTRIGGANVQERRRPVAPGGIGRTGDRPFNGRDATDVPPSTLPRHGGPTDGACPAGVTCACAGEADRAERQRSNNGDANANHANACLSVGARQWALPALQHPYRQRSRSVPTQRE